MRYFLYNFFFFSFAVFVSFNNTSIAQTYNFDVFSVDKGLSQSEVTSINEDSRGYSGGGGAGGAREPPAHSCGKPPARELRSL